MLRRLMEFSVVFLILLFLLIAGQDRAAENRAGAQAAAAKHGLTGTYYVANVEIYSDVEKR